MIMRWTKICFKKRNLWYNIYCDDYEMRWTEICEHSLKKEAYDMIMKSVNTVLKKRSLWYNNYIPWWLWNVWTQLKKKEAYDIIYTVMIMKYVEKKRNLWYCDDYVICEHSFKKKKLMI